MRCSSFWGEDVNDEEDNEGYEVSSVDEEVGIKATLRSG
jgi:hypothetical protein